MADSFPSHDMEMIVTWGDCDAAGISYYAKAFDWFTNGRMRFMQVYGFPYMETFHGNGISLVCLKADCDYKKMLRPEEPVTVRTSLTALSRSRMTFTYQVLKQDGKLACEGTTSHTYVDDQGLPFNVEKRFPELWKQISSTWSGALAGKPSAQA